MGAAFCWFMGLKPLLKSLQSQDWPQVNCVITTSEVITNHSSDGNTYKVNIQFSYQYDGQHYNGGSYDFSDISSSGRKSKSQIVRQYPVDSQALCYVNPAQPSQAVITNTIPKIAYFTIPFSSIFILIGAGCMAGALGLAPKKWQNKLNSQHQPVDTRPAGSTQLKPETSGIAKLIGAICIAIFWNGITSVFVNQAIQSHQQGDPDWTLTLFISPFVIIGLTLIGSIFYYLFALANPKLTLQVSEASPQLGQTIELSWHSNRPLDRLQSFALYLEGIESATYRRGTNTVTDKCIFHREALIETTRATAHANDRLQITIPNASMHSFTSANNKILWQIQLEGDIRLWPDIKENYPITVRPQSPQNA